MPRYFFHVSLPIAEPDNEGTELPDIQTAQQAAVRLCGELIREIEGKFWEAPLWQMRVTDHERRLLFTLTFSAEDHDPAP